MAAGQQLLECGSCCQHIHRVELQTSIETFCFSKEEKHCSSLLCLAENKMGVSEESSSQPERCQQGAAVRNDLISI